MKDKQTSTDKELEKLTKQFDKEVTRFLEVIYQYKKRVQAIQNKS